MRRQIDKIINEVTLWLLQLSLTAPFCIWGTLGKHGVSAVPGMVRAHGNIMLFYYRVLKIWHQQLGAAEYPRAYLLLGKPDQISHRQPCRQLKIYCWLFVLPWCLLLASLVLKEWSSFGVDKAFATDRTWRPLQMSQIESILSWEPQVICVSGKSLKVPTPPLRSPAHQHCSLVNKLLLLR